MSTENGAPASGAINGAPGATVGAPATTPGTPDRASLRAAKLKFTDDGRPATLAALGDERRELTANERIKLEKPGPKVWDDIVNRYAKEGFAAIETDDFERFKWVGLYQQRPKDGYFMIRLKVPGGVMTSDQLRVIGDLSRRFARGIADITTRQTFQMHWLTIECVPELMEQLYTVQLGVLAELFGACGDICRNIVGSPLAGVDLEEHLDPTALVHEASQYFSSNPDYADLPRKYKVGMFGHRDAGQCEINDLSFYGVTRLDGTKGYGSMVGGGLSTEPHIAQELNVFVKPEAVMAVLEAVTRLFRDHGYRKSRKHARLKFLVADWGAEKFRTEIENLIGYKLEDAEPQPKAKGYGDSYGVHPQAQPGLSYIGVPVIAGRLTSDQIEEIARITDELAGGEIRATVMQSFYIPNVPDANVAEVVRRLEAIELPLEVSAIRKGVVACTGIEFCNLAVTETKARAGKLVQILDAKVRWTDSELFRVNVNGCPNSCGQHWIADVGLQGCTKKVDGELVEHYDVFLGGGLGEGASFNRRITRVAAEDVASTIENVMASYQSQKQNGESFKTFVARHSDEDLEAML